MSTPESAATEPMANIRAVSEVTSGEGVGSSSTIASSAPSSILQSPSWHTMSSSDGHWSWQNTWSGWHWNRHTTWDAGWQRGYDEGWEEGYASRREEDSRLRIAVMRERMEHARARRQLETRVEDLERQVQWTRWKFAGGVLHPEPDAEPHPSADPEPDAEPKCHPR